MAGGLGAQSIGMDTETLRDQPLAIFCAKESSSSLNRQMEYLLDRALRDKAKGEAGELPRPKGGRRQRT